MYSFVYKPLDFAHSSAYICIHQMDTSVSNDILRGLIEQSGYKNRFIAAYADMSESMLSLVIDGKRSLSIEKARKIAEILSRSIGREITIDEIWPPVNSSPTTTTNSTAGLHGSTRPNAALA